MKYILTELGKTRRGKYLALDYHAQTLLCSVLKVQLHKMFSYLALPLSQ